MILRLLPTVAFAALLISSTSLAGDITTVAGTGAKTLSATEGVATKVNVGQPFGVEVGPGGALYITEVENHRVLRLDRTSGQLTTVAGTGEKGYSGDGGPATEARLNEPYEVRFDSRGNMYFVEMMNHVIRVVEAETGKIRTLAGTGDPGFGGDGGPAIAAELNRPHSIALDPTEKYLFVADIGNHRIRRIELATGTIETFAGSKQKKLPHNGQLARGNPVLGPRALAVSDKRLYVALREGHSVWYIDLATEQWHHVAGTGQKGYSGARSGAKTATFNGPKGVAIGPAGGVYVVDTENQAIRKIDPAAGTIETIAGSGPQHRGGKGDGGVATKAELDRPHGIAVDSDGVVYIGDTNNHRVRSVQPD